VQRDLWLILVSTLRILLLASNVEMKNEYLRTSFYWQVVG